MKSEVGLWIDHRKAVIVTIKNEVEVIREIRSNIEKHPRFSNDANSNAPDEAHEPTAEDMRDRKFADHLDNFYGGIVSLVRNADSIWIFGPGEAKIELEEHLKRDGLGARVVGIETIDKMTDHQIAAKVRDHFLR